MSLFDGTSNTNASSISTTHFKPFKDFNSSTWNIYRHHLVLTTSSTTQASSSKYPKKASSSLSTAHLLATMSFHHAKKILRRSLSIGKESVKTQKGHVAVYVGEEEKRRHTVPVSYLNHPLFQDLLSRAEEEFGYNHPMGGLTIPCSEDTFLSLVSQMRE